MNDLINDELKEYPANLSYTTESYLANKGLCISSFDSRLSKMAKICSSFGRFGYPSSCDSDNKTIYRGNQINYLDIALRLILDI